jgi:hypothetical protein
MASLKEKNAHERDDHISMEEETHTYSIDGDTGFLSVTSWINSLFPKFDAGRVIDRMMASPN